MRLSFPFVSILLVTAACGGGGGAAAPDAASTDVGFKKPTMPLMANMEGSGSATTYTTVGPANLACLGTASTDVATTLPITLNTQVTDFQTGDLVPSATVTAFAGSDFSTPFFTGTSDATTANIAVTVPTGTTRFGFKMTADQQIDTLLLFQYLDPSTAVQTVPADIQSVSESTAQVLPALIGQTRITGTGVVAGALRDCDNNEISNFIATMSSTSGTATPITGAEAYYFSATGKVPVRYSQAEASTADGLFMEIQVPTASASYVQLWGYPTAADVTSDNLTLISEQAVPVVADTVITGSFLPIRH